MVATWGDGDPALPTVQKCKTAEFRNGRDGVVNKPRFGAATTQSCSQHGDGWHDMRLTINQITTDIRMSRERIDNILHNELSLNQFSMSYETWCHVTSVWHCLRQILLISLNVSFPNQGWVLGSSLWTRDKETIHAVVTPLLTYSKEGQSFFFSIGRESDVLSYF